MKVFDAHVHIGLNNFSNGANNIPYNLENKYEDYLLEMKNANVTKACILPIPDSAFDAQKCNDYLKEAALFGKEHFAAIARLNINLPEILNQGFYGAKLHCVYENIEKKQMVEYLQILEAAEKPLIVHAKFKDKPAQVKSIMKVVPNLKIVLAHMGRGHIYTSEDVIENAKALKNFDNVFFETSTVGDSEAIKKACDIVGSSRIMFGSDYPFGKIYLKKYKYIDDVNFILDSSINDNDKDNILFNTANTLFQNGEISESYVIKYTKQYKDELEALIKKLSKEDIKFLALDKKMKILHDCMKKEAHLYIIIYQGRVAGFLRQSDRRGGISLLEELAISPEYRKKGLASKMLSFYIKKFPNSIAKSNANNNNINRLLDKYGFKKTKGVRIYEWERR